MPTLQLGSSGDLTGAWQWTMLTRFSGYAKAADGRPLNPDRYFGYDDQAVQRQYEFNTNQPQDGVVSDWDLRALGLRPTILSVHGTGQADPFGIGYPADIARRLEDLCYWNPVGNYPAIAVPMDESAAAGERELVRLINDRNITPGPFLISDYSQGSICGGRVRNRLRTGDLKHRYKDFLGSVSIGNPMRPAGSYAGNKDPGGHGIDPTLETAAEPYCLNLAAKGDIYTTCPDGNTGEMMRAIFNAVFRRWTGKDSVPEQLGEMVTNPVPEVAAAGAAMWRGGIFVLKGTGPHVRYHLDQCPGTGQTYYEHGVTHLRRIAMQHVASKARAA